MSIVKQTRHAGRTFILAVVALAAAGGQGYATTSTWNNFSSAGVGWMTGANWLPAAIPARSVDLVLRFDSQPAAYISTDNFSGTPFTLNGLDFEGTGAALTTITVSNVALAFSTNSGNVAPSIVENSSGGFLVQGNGGISVNNGDLHLQGNGTGLVELKAIISGTNHLIVDGNAAFALTADNSTFSGGVTVNSGTLRLGTGSASVLGTGTLSLNGGSVTSVSSTAIKSIVNQVGIQVGANKTVTFGDTNSSYNGALTFLGTLAIGQNATVQVNSALTMSNAAVPALGSNVAFNIGSAATLNVSSFDISNNVTLSLNLGATSAFNITNALTGTPGTLNFNLEGGTPGGIYTLLTFGSNSLSYSNLNLLSSTYALDTSFGTGGWLFTGSSLEVEVQAVPEPSIRLLAVLGGGLLIAMRCRHFRKLIFS